MKYIEALRGLSEEGMVSKKERTFWHTKKEKLDFEKAVSSSNPIEELKNQIIEAVNKLDEFADVIKERLSLRE